MEKEKTRRAKNRERKNRDSDIYIRLQEGFVKLVRFLVVSLKLD